MLILSRKEGDAILLDGGIRIVVLACDRRGVRIGIEAPPHVSIVRGEIVAQIEDANRRATASPAATAFLEQAGLTLPKTPAGPARVPAP
jgi:carbon storage regulator